jgi:hypothetical protein
MLTLLCSSNGLESPLEPPGVNRYILVYIGIYQYMTLHSQGLVMALPTSMNLCVLFSKVLGTHTY